MKNFLKSNLHYLIVAGMFILIREVGMASSSDMPFVGPLEEIMLAITGPVAKYLAIICVAGCGLAMSFGEMGGAMKRLVNIVFGISIVFAAVSWVPTFFSFSGGVNF